MTDETLSRYLDDDLSPDERAHVEDALRTDPALRERLDRLEDLVAALETLPEHTPPPLEARVLVTPTKRPIAWSRWAGLALAAAAVLTFFLPPPSDQLVMREGEALLDGDLSVQLPGGLLALDGRARIQVEPPTPALRDPRHPKEDPMTTRSFLAGAAGAALVVTLYEGAALWSPTEGAPLPLTPGEPHALSPGRTTPLAPQRPSAPVSAESRAELQAEIASLKEELAKERFAGALVRGQLKAGQGEPVDWPDAGVPDDFTQGRFEASLREQLAQEGFEHLALTDVDCSEYPCLASLRYTGPDEGMEWGQDALERFDPWIGGNFPNANVSASHSGFRTDDQNERFMVLGVHDAGAEGVDDRVRWRMNQMVELLGEDVRSGRWKE